MNHTEATPIIRAAWIKVHGREPTTLETLYTQAIASLETGYGRAGQFGNLAAQGKYNWGAEQRKVNTDGSCPTGFALGQDQGTVCFYVFPSDIDAAAAFIKTLTKTKWDTIPAMTGSAEDVARAMRRPPAYYAGDPSKTEEEKIQAYANAIRNNAKQIGGALENQGRQILDNKVATQSNSRIGLGLITLGVLGGVIYTQKSKKWSL